MVTKKGADTSTFTAEIIDVDTRDNYLLMLMMLYNIYTTKQLMVESEMLKMKKSGLIILEH